MDLNREDLNILLDAVEVWEKQESNDALMTELVTAVLSPTGPDPEAKAQRHAEREARLRAGAEEHQLRKEQSILLRAKLIQMRDAADAAQMIDSALTPTR